MHGIGTQSLTFTNSSSFSSRSSKLSIVLCCNKIVRINLIPMYGCVCESSFLQRRAPQKRDHTRHSKVKTNSVSLKSLPYALTVVNRNIPPPFHSKVVTSTLCRPSMRLFAALIASNDVGIWALVRINACKGAWERQGLDK